jgi:hypothetical protein
MVDVGKLLSEGTDYQVWEAVAFDRNAVPVNRVQQIAELAWIAEGMIGNRGFYNHTAEEMGEWAAAYDELGITTAAEAIRAAAKIMPLIDWDNDDPLEQQLELLERQYYATRKQTEAAVAALIRAHPVEAFANGPSPPPPTNT